MKILSTIKKLKETVISIGMIGLIVVMAGCAGSSSSSVDNDSASSFLGQVTVAGTVQALASDLQQVSETTGAARLALSQTDLLGLATVIEGEKIQAVLFIRQIKGAEYMSRVLSCMIKLLSYLHVLGTIEPLGIKKLLQHLKMFLNLLIAI